MLSPIVTQGFGYKNNTIAFVTTQGFGLFDSAGVVIIPPEPVVSLDTGQIADYINQGIIQVRNSRVSVAYQKRGYRSFDYGRSSGVKDVLNTRFSPQFGVVFDRYNEPDY